MRLEQKRKLRTGSAVNLVEPSSSGSTQSKPKKRRRLLPRRVVKLHTIPHPDDPERRVTYSKFPFNTMGPPLLSRDGRSLKALVEYPPNKEMYNDISSPEDKARFFFECIKYGMTIDVPKDIKEEITIQDFKNRRPNESKSDPQVAFFLCLQCSILDFEATKRVNGYANQYRLWEHMDNMHKLTPIPLYECRECKKLFVESEELLNHRTGLGECNIEGRRGDPDKYILPSEPFSPENYLRGSWSFVSADIHYPYTEDVRLLEFTRHQLIWDEWLGKFQNLLKQRNGRQTVGAYLGKIWKEHAGNRPVPVNRKGKQTTDYTFDNGPEDTIVFEFIRIIDNKLPNSIKRNSRENKLPKENGEEQQEKAATEEEKVGNGEQTPKTWKASSPPDGKGQDNKGESDSGKSYSHLANGTSTGTSTTQNSHESSGPIRATRRKFLGMTTISPGSSPVVRRRKGDDDGSLTSSCDISPNVKHSENVSDEADTDKCHNAAERSMNSEPSILSNSGLSQNRITPSNMDPQKFYEYQDLPGFPEYVLNVKSDSECDEEA